MPTLIEDRDVALKSAGDIVNGAKAASRDLTVEENTLIKGFLDSVDQIDAKISAGKETETLLKRLGTVGEKEDTTPSTVQADTLGEHFVKSGAHAQFLKGNGQRSVSSPEFKAAGDPFLAAALGKTQYGPVISTRLRRLTVADLLSSGTLSASSLTYWSQGTVTGAVTAVAENGLKPSLNFSFTEITETLTKVAGITKVSTEATEDTDYLVSVINTQLIQRLQVVEEDQLLNGSGVAPNMTGLLNRSGIQTYGATGDLASLNLDKIYHGLTLVDTGTSLMPPDGIIIHPTDYERLRLAKDDNDQYYGGGPFTGAYGNGDIRRNLDLWGLTTVVTPAIAAGTVLVGAFQAGGQVFRKGGITIDSTNSNEDDFKYNRVALRAEERLLLAVYYASAFAKLTLGTA